MKMISISCVEMIKKFEGCRLKAYKPIASEKYYTIGYGHYGADVTPNMEITQTIADSLLIYDLFKYVSAVNDYDLIYNWTQGELDALTSFSYNCGIGNLKKLLDNGKRSKTEIANAMLLYNKAGGVILKGLKNRREYEHDVFLNHGYK